MPTNTDKITTTTGEEFSREAESDPTTGYTWEPNYDEKMLNLISYKFHSYGK
ncbi:MAG TPA: hypothetical protein VFD60_00155 [Nitrososphaeraceae archaeon]|jgi:predicted secreted protein|nr:hypothetical protein [Nitrososphaeraceae archaeon]